MKSVEKTDRAIYYYLNGKLHREDGPAIEYVTGSKLWYLNGKKHRLDGPAEKCPKGTKYWYIDGKRHREDGPAIEWADGRKEWYKSGKLHREDGPAFIANDNCVNYYANDLLHRENGPAIIRGEYVEYWDNGQFIYNEGSGKTYKYKCDYDNNFTCNFTLENVLIVFNDVNQKYIYGKNLGFYYTKQRGRIEFYECDTCHQQFILNEWHERLSDLITCDEYLIGEVLE